MKREIPMIITFVSGMAIIIALFVPHPPFGRVEETFNNWYIIISGFTMILGLNSLLGHNLDKVKRKAEGWPYSLTLILSFFITLIWGIVSTIRTGHIFASTSTFRNYYYTYVFVPLQSTMFALLAFFIASAAYRAFRARTVNATLLLVTASIIMLTQVPKGETVMAPVLGVAALLAVWKLMSEFESAASWTAGLPYLLLSIAIVAVYLPIVEVLRTQTTAVNDWIMNVLQMGAKRGIWLGIALGGIAMGLRIIFGIEKSYLT
ncbi:MAG: hypothetical protein DRQ10_00520 [Candidatus Hydrothermota bacterium]|nr:MAG: hypothetical protein DRQ10_00520 [Candidatus Hydrothermae bacterium]